VVSKLDPLVAPDADFEAPGVSAALLRPLSVVTVRASTVRTVDAVFGQ